jgi:hypothetical protein
VSSFNARFAFLIVAFGTVLCFSQENSQKGASATGVAAGRDEAGRVVQPVGASSVALLPPTSPDQRQAFRDNVKDLYFDFNRADLTDDDEATLKKDCEMAEGSSRCGVHD